jgi:hypothetical protein
MANNTDRAMRLWKEFEGECINEVGMFHDPKTGRFSKNKTGAVKSLTKKGARENGIDAEHVGRGVVTSKGNISAKMGQNFGKETSCGRKTIDGEDIVPKYKCGDYKKRYAQEGVDLEEYPEIKDGVKLDMAQVLEALSANNQELDEQQGCDCGKYKTAWLQDTLKSLNSYALAMKGDLLPRKEGDDPKEKSHYQGSPIQKDKHRKTDKRKAADRRRSIRSQTGVYVEPFNRGEKSLLNPNSLMERPSSIPKKAVGKKA